MKKSVIFGRSECDFCHHPLAIIDLVPVFSFLFLWGKCRYCNHTLSWQYPLIELVTATLLVGLFVLLQPLPSLLSVAHFLFVCFLILDLFVLSVIDSKYGVLPNRNIVLGITAQLFLLIMFSPSLLMSSLLSAFGSFVFLGLIVLITAGRGMGMGDVKFAFLMGLMVGFPAIIPAFYIAFLTGACVAIILIVTGKKKFHGGSIPFGPFLIIGTFAGYFWGIQIWNLLLHVLGL